MNRVWIAEGAISSLSPQVSGACLLLPDAKNGAIVLYVVWRHCGALHGPLIGIFNIFCYAAYQLAASPNVCECMQ